VHCKELGAFSKSRRARVQPTEVGLARGARRRVPGLRRDEVALLAGISTDYYVELEQGRGPRPSEQVLIALAAVLRLSDDERDYLFRLANYVPPCPHPAETGGSAFAIDPTLHELYDRLAGTPTMIITGLHEVLAQNALAMALLGAKRTGPWPDGSVASCWFRKIMRSTPGCSSATFACRWPAGATIPRPRRSWGSYVPRASELSALWNSHDVATMQKYRKRIVHPEHGVIEVICHNLFSENRRQRLLWFSPVPGTAANRQFAALGAGEAKPVR
jgi:transcriptional regulator with XRE-family HTH domain